MQPLSETGHHCCQSLTLEWLVQLRQALLPGPAKVTQRLMQTRVTLAEACPTLPARKSAMKLQYSGLEAMETHPLTIPKGCHEKVRVPCEDLTGSCRPCCQYLTRNICCVIHSAFLVYLSASPGSCTLK